MKTYCEFTFEAAHSVAPYSGLHGHTFIVKLTFGGAVDEVYGWPVNLYDVENYIKEIKGEHGSGLDHGNLDLNPEIGIASLENVRKDPRFKDIARDYGYYEYWRTTGEWSDFCRPVGEDDFECW